MPVTDPIPCGTCGELGPCRDPETRQFVKRHVPAQPEPAPFDNGGWLKPGVTTEENRTAVPDPVLAPPKRSRWPFRRKDRAA